MDPDFLALLVCPTTRQPLRSATEAEVVAVNRAIEAGVARTRGGEPVEEPVAAALATADGAWLYPVQNGIPILLAPAAIRSGSEAGS